ncbi:MAG: SusE domain-containing protein [Bacteroides sp.]|nr:SusE domain-containing protein [Bacteroides sp.]
MKRYIHLILPFLLLPLVSSCENDTDGPTLTEITPSVISSLPSGVFDLSSYDEENDNPLLFTLRWSPTEFHMKGNSAPQGVAPITYSIEIDRSGNNFADPATLAATTADTVDVFRKDLNDFLLSQLKLEAFETYELELRLSVKFGEGNHEFNQLYSENKVTFTAIPSEGLQHVYIIGDMNGWNNSNTDFMMFRDNSDETEFDYIYVGRIAENTYFKFVSESNLGTWNLFCDAGNGELVLDEDGGAFYNDKERYVKILLNIKQLTYSIEEYDASKATKWDHIIFVGAFCNWGDKDDNEEDDNEDENLAPEMEKSTYDPHIWSLDVNLPTVEWGVKFRTKAGWDIQWGVDGASSLPYGKISFTDEGVNLPNIYLETGPGDYHIRLNTLSNHYIFIKQ